MEKLLRKYLCEKACWDDIKPFTADQLLSILGSPPDLSAYYSIGRPGEVYTAYLLDDGTATVLPLSSTESYGSGECELIGAFNHVQAEYCRGACTAVKENNVLIDLNQMLLSHAAHL